MFIGADEILKEQKDAKGYTKVFFKPIEKDGETIEIEPKVFSNLILDELKTAEPMDFNFIRKVRCTPAKKEILEVLLKYNVQLEDEIGVILNGVAKSLDNNHKLASDKVWGICQEERTMLDVHRVIKK